MATKERDLKATRGITLKRFFTKQGTHPFDEVEWETRDAVIPNFKEGGYAGFITASLNTSNRKCAVVAVTTTPTKVSEERKNQETRNKQDAGRCWLAS